MLYVDTNIFVYAIENHPKYGAACKRVLLAVEQGKIAAAGSVLVLVELQSVLRKLNKLLQAGGKRAVDIPASIDAVLSYPFTWLDLDFLTVKKAAGYDFQIAGADCIHVASMEILGIQKIVSADRELDRVRMIERIDPLDFKP